MPVCIIYHIANQAIRVCLVGWIGLQRVFSP
ncbi:hypothetical protein PUN4_900003 [Paraburkholderia unamae]|nr:hypothetical protein PUN4_900003 [Paraburkholderia unamae]